MARKKTVVSKEVTEINEKFKENKIILGSERVIKNLKQGKLAKIFVSSNCKDDVKQDLINYSSIADVELIELKQSGDELSVICKKPFVVSTLGFLK